MDKALVLARLEKFEGRMPHMYVCTGGEVTIGVGHAIPGPDAAVKLPWALGGRPAAEADVRADFGRVAAAPKGLAATGYAKLSRVRLENAAIDALAAADVDRFTGDLAKSLPNFGRYPACVQTALFDMAFNLGVAGLLKFQKLITACDAANWEAAAGECHRKGIGESRNLETSAFFRQALTKET